MQPERVLVVITRRIGDVLLATPLVRSFKRAWPHARIDALVFSGTEPVLAGNPDLDEIITVPERPGLIAHARLHAALLRKYDLAASLLTGDRPTLYAWTSGRFSAGLQMTDGQSRWKRWLLDQWVPFDDLDTHTVRMNLALAQALGVEAIAEVVVSWRDADRQRLHDLHLGDAGEPYAILHPSAKFNYKMWHLEGWMAVAEWITARGFRLYLSGSGEAQELQYAEALAMRLGKRAHNLAGTLSLGALGCLLSRAALYVGPDTAVTHMSAALGVPTVALFGPSNPVKWGPWPKGHDAARNPWRRVGTQHAGNVTLVQGAGTCVPCLMEGCERHVASYSDCLQHLAPRTVIAAMERRLSTPSPA
jgi:heptosyltransferase-3